MALSHPVLLLHVRAQGRRIINRFWGRTRWARTRLREVALKNHGVRIGLYRAKVTRFAGRYRELARLLRLKNDLKEVVVCEEYDRQKFNDGPRNKAAHLDSDSDDDEDDDLGEYDGITDP
eukprot:5585289-Pleurochrysis_carterae.AAC.1